MNARVAASSDAHINRLNAYTSALRRSLDSSREPEVTKTAPPDPGRRPAKPSCKPSAFETFVERRTFPVRSADPRALAASRATLTRAAAPSRADAVSLSLSLSLSRRVTVAVTVCDASALVALLFTRTLSAAAAAAAKTAASASARSRAMASAEAAAFARASSLAERTLAAAAAAAAAAEIAATAEEFDASARLLEAARARAAASSLADLTLAAAAAAAAAADADGEVDALRTRAGPRGTGGDGDEGFVVEASGDNSVASFSSRAFRFSDPDVSDPDRLATGGRTVSAATERVVADAVLGADAVADAVVARRPDLFGVGRGLGLGLGDMAVARKGCTRIEPVPDDDDDDDDDAEATGAVPHADVAA